MSFTVKEFRSRFGNIVNAATTPSEAFDKQQSEPSVFDPYAFRVGEAYVEYPMMARVVSLISGVTAQIIANPHTKITNAKGDVIRKQGGIKNLVTHSPDGRISAYQFWEDVAKDLTLEGNSIITIDRAGNKPSMLSRLYPYQLTTRQTSDGTMVYQGLDEYGNCLLYTSPSPRD